jgi:hypothetical protein
VILARIGKKGMHAGSLYRILLKKLYLVKRKGYGRVT